MSASTKIKLSVNGMSCTGCEQRIENALRKLDGVKIAVASFAATSVVIECDGALISPESLIGELSRLGYGARLTRDEKSAVKKTSVSERTGFSPATLAGIAVIIIVVVLLLERTGLFSALPIVTENMGFGLLFVIGLLTSVHCIAMCGGINLSQAAKGTATGPEPLGKRLLPGLLYNLGRLISYTVIGGVVGALGSVISISGIAQAVVIMIGGLFMLLMGINMLGIFPGLKKIMPRLPKALTTKLAGKVTGKGPLLIGLVNGFMPCGPLQSMQLYALATGSFIAGASSMFLFALGTIPLMFLFGTVGTLFVKRFGRRVFSVSAILVVVLGVGMVSRGFALSGMGFPLVEETAAPSTVARLLGGRQEVVSGITSNSYQPITVQAGVPVRWTIQAASADLNGCNNAILIPSYGITKKLVPGDNIVEFTAKASGTIRFTCWMGMIQSYIRVVDDVANISPDELAQVEKEATNAVNDAFSFPVTIAKDGFQPGVITEGVQRVKFDIQDAGYLPAIAVVKKGVPTEINFFGNGLDPDTERMIVPLYNARLQFREGDNVVQFTPETDFYFSTWTATVFGAVLVVEDVAAIDPVVVTQRVRALEESAGALLAGGAQGGCH